MTKKEIATKIAALGRFCGITSGYLDNFGCRRRTSLKTYKSLLTAMGVPWEDPALLEQELKRRGSVPFQRLLPPVQIISPAARPRMAFYPWSQGEVPSKMEVHGEMVNEAGRRITWEAPVKAPAHAVSRPVEGGFRTRLSLFLPENLEIGYYDLDLRVRAGVREEQGQTRLIIAPARVYLPPWLAAGRRAWGLNFPLYALRSDSNWGIGDFGDLLEAISWAASLEGAFVGVSPLHAHMPGPDADPSPYFPASRVFLNFLYLNLEMSPEFVASPEARALLGSQAFHLARSRLQTSELVAYPEVYQLKRQVLEMLYQTFEDLHGPPEAPRSLRGEEFARFLAESGELLAKFGQYGALADFFHQADWRLWPAPYQSPESPLVAAFSREHPREVHLHQYAQWLAASQLAQVCARARDRGLPFTLYQDQALSPAPGGFDAWAHQRLFAQGASIGAPPDVFNPRGQNWGLPPMIPERCRESGHQLFIAALRANCPPEGLLRLDHVMGLFRLFWIPRGEEPSQGAYVTYPARELLAVLALESTRRRTLIIGEDLGTVAPRIRRGLVQAGIFSYRVFSFERDLGNGFRPPEAYPRQAMAAVTTHDLPTLTGFWQGKDIELKRNFNLYPQPHQAQVEAACREKDRALILGTLAHRGLLPPGFSPPPSSESCPEEVRGAVLEYLAQSGAALLEVRLEEIFGLAEQQNFPGTRTEHPNWRLKFPLTLSQMRQAPEAARLAARVNKYRGRNSGGGG